MQQLIQKFVLPLGLLILPQALYAAEETGYENRPLPTVSAELGQPAAPAKSATCVVPEAKTWSEISVSRLALEAQGTCAAPLKATAEGASAPSLKR